MSTTQDAFYRGYRDQCIKMGYYNSNDIARFMNKTAELVKKGAWADFIKHFSGEEGKGLRDALIGGVIGLGAGALGGYGVAGGRGAMLGGLAGMLGGAGIGGMYGEDIGGWLSGLFGDKKEQAGEEAQRDKDIPGEDEEARENITIPFETGKGKIERPGIGDEFAAANAQALAQRQTKTTTQKDITIPAASTEGALSPGASAPTGTVGKPLRESPQFPQQALPGGSLFPAPDPRDTSRSSYPRSAFWPRAKTQLGIPSPQFFQSYK